MLFIRSGKMQCPNCGSEQVLVRDSRMTTNNRRRRRYICDGCGNRFTTYEYTAYDIENLNFSEMTDDMKGIIRSELRREAISGIITELEESK